MNYSNETVLISTVSRLAFGSALALLTLCGTVGNLLVIVSIVPDDLLRRSPMNRLLANLALADLGNLLVCVPDWLQPMVTGEQHLWVLAGVLCPMIRYLQVVFLYCSVITQVIVCIERYIAITHPLRVRIWCGTNTSYGSMLVAWLASATFGLPYFALHHKHHGHCSMAFPDRTFLYVFKLAECLVFYFTPMLVLGVLYSRMSISLWRPWSGRLRRADTTVDHSNSEDTSFGSLRRLRQRRRHNNNNSDENATVTPLNRGETQMRVSHGRAAVEKRKTVIKMLLVCVIVYFVCYSPIQALFLSVTVFNRPLLQRDTPYRHEIILVFNTLATASSACNPIIYTLFYEKFRIKFYRIICCLKAPEDCNRKNKMVDKTYAPSYQQSSTTSLINNHSMINAGLPGRFRTVQKKSKTFANSTMLRQMDHSGSSTTDVMMPVIAEESDRQRGNVASNDLVSRKLTTTSDVL